MAWSDPEHEEVLQALAVVCEVTGANYSQPARQFLMRELESYAAMEVLVALRRCARECTHRLVLADVIKRIDEEREKDAAHRRAQRSIAETQERLKALREGRPWEEVKKLFNLKPPDPAQEAKRSRALEAAKHWSETDADD